MKITQRLSRISDLFERWRSGGSKRLSNGVELFCRIDDEDSTWLHALFPAPGSEQIEELERGLGRSLPSSLRAFYRGCGGLTAFGGLVEVCGYCPSLVIEDPKVHAPSDILRLNRSVASLGWLPEGGVAFATNGLDSSVYVTGVPTEPRVVRRCVLRDGREIGRNADLFEFLEQRLYALEGFEELELETSPAGALRQPCGD